MKDTVDISVTTASKHAEDIAQAPIRRAKQADEIARARALLNPSPVRANHEPRWFMQALQAARRAVHDRVVAGVHATDPTVRVPKFVAGDGHYEGYNRYSHIGLWCVIERLVDEASSIDDQVQWHLARDFSGDRYRRTEVEWLDHTGSATWGKGRAWVSEPYPHAITAESMRQIQLVADLTNLHSGISANSWHYPGHTVRIVFWEKDGCLTHEEGKP